MPVSATTFKDYVVFWATIAVYLVFVLLVLTAFSPLKIFKGKYARRQVVVTVFQPRFYVYTRRVDEPIYQLYKVQGNTLQVVDQRPFVKNYWFGLNRTNKIIGSEIDNLLNDTATMTQVRKIRMVVPYGEALGASLGLDSIRFTEIRPRNIYYLHGKYLLTKAPPKKWVTSRSKLPIELEAMPINIQEQ
jgi:hypothetical protein